MSKWLLASVPLIGAVAAALLALSGEWMVACLVIVASLVLAFTCGPQVLGRPHSRQPSSQPDAKAVRDYRVTHPEATISEAFDAVSAHH